MTKARILFVIPSLRGGGAERVALRILSHLCRDRFEPHVALVERTGPFLAQLPGDVVVHDLGAGRVARAAGPLLRLVWRLRPKTVLTMMSHLNLVASVVRPLFPAATSLIIRDANIVRRLPSPKGLNRWAYAAAFRRADAVVCQTDFMRWDLQRVLHLPPQKLTTIYNPLDVEAILQQARAVPSPFGRAQATTEIVTLGRLDAVKGLDRLMDAFPALVQRRPDARLWVLGQGPLEDRLRRQAQRLGIADRVHFVGYQSDPFGWLYHADLCVVSSRFECAPNALLEAIACKCPVIVQDHPGGSREILECTGQTDRFVPELGSWHSSWFRRPAEAIHRRLKEHFDIGVTIPMYERLLESPQEALAGLRAA